MNTLSTVLGVLSLVGGMICFLLAILGATNTLQGIFYGVLSIAAFMFTSVLLSAARDNDE